MLLFARTSPQQKDTAVVLDRRAFLCTLGLLAAPLGAEAQPAGRIVRIGVPSFGEPEPFREGFRQALGELGYVEGRNAAVEHCWAQSPRSTER